MFKPILRLGGLWLTSILSLGFTDGVFAQQDGPLQLTWKDNLLHIHAPYLPGGSVEIWYLEAFCRKWATDRKWSETVIPHSTHLLNRSEDGTRLKLRSEIDPGVVAEHTIQSDTDEVAFAIRISNPTRHPVDIQWAQPCIRVGRFTGLGQEDYWKRSFIFVEGVLTRLDHIPRSQEALYRGGQVYVPKSVDPKDVNPRPLSEIAPTPPIIGCFSEDDRWLLATAWDSTQELFQGVITCIHSDFRIGGLDSGETKSVFGKLYLLPNDSELLLRAWESDFSH